MNKQTSFGYTRLSQNSDESAGLSIENQKYEIEQYCLKHNIQLLKIFNEGFHPGDRDRPVFKQMLDLSKNLKPSLIIARDSTRFARDASLIIDIYDDMEVLGIKFVSITEGSMLEHKLPRDMMAIIAEMQRTKGKQYQREMIERKKQQGMPFGCVPFGYKAIDKKWFVNKEEADKIRFIYTKFITGKYTLTDIAHDVQTSKQQVRAILRNPIYTGLFQYTIRIRDKNKKIIKTESGEYRLKDFHRVIPQELWDQAQERFKVTNLRRFAKVKDAI